MHDDVTTDVRAVGLALHPVERQETARAVVDAPALPRGTAQVVLDVLHRVVGFAYVGDVARVHQRKHGLRIIGGHGSQPRHDGHSDSLMEGGVMRTSFVGDDGSMSDAPQRPDGLRIVTLGPDGTAIEGTPDGTPDGAPMEDAEESQLTDMVEQPAKVMRIGTMIKQLLEEVRAAPLDDASRSRLREVYDNSIKELSSGLAPELREELERLSLPFSEDGVPSDAELRIAQAQLVGWLEGLFHGIQTALFAQQMAARAQLEEMRRRALPPGATPSGPQQSGPYL